MASIFQRIFQRQKPPSGETSRAEILGGGSSFAAWGGNAYSNDIYRSAVDAIARNAAKLKGSHVVHCHDSTSAEGDNRINRILQTEPNPYMSAFDLLYKLVTLYYQHNNAFAYLQWDERGQLAGIYPLNPVHVEFVTDAGGTLYCSFLFPGGKEAVLPYASIVHLRRHYSGGDLLGDQNTALDPALQLAHTQNEGLMSSIKNSAKLRGILKRNQTTNLDMLKELQEKFVRDYLDISNNGGVAALDMASEFIPLNSNAASPVDDKQLAMVKGKIFDYLGVSEKIVNSSYTEDEWAAFYESTIEPLAVQLSLEFTRKIFNERERAFGNVIHFESGRLQFSSNATKVALLKELMPLGLLTVNQGMEILNLPAVEGGEIRYQTLNVVNAANAEKYQMSRAGLPAAQKEMQTEGAENE